MPDIFQEYHLSEKYHEALRKIIDKDYTRARELLEEALSDPLISNIQAEDNGEGPRLRELRLVNNSWILLAHKKKQILRI